MDDSKQVCSASVSLIAFKCNRTDCVLSGFSGCLYSLACAAYMLLFPVLVNKAHRDFTTGSGSCWKLCRLQICRIQILLYRTVLSQTELKRCSLPHSVFHWDGLFKLCLTFLLESFFYSFNISRWGVCKGW